MTVLSLLFTWWCLIVGTVTLAAVVIGAVCVAAMKVSEYREGTANQRRCDALIRNGGDLWNAPVNREQARSAR